MINISETLINFDEMVIKNLKLRSKVLVNPAQPLVWKYNCYIKRNCFYI